MFVCLASNLLMLVGGISHSSRGRIPRTKLNSFARICLDDQHSRHVSLMPQVCGDMSSIPLNVARSAHRKLSKERFLGRAGVVYTVKGKGGLVREVLIPSQLAKELELRRLPEPEGINHQQHYDITAEQSFSHIFTKASVKHLGWSTGAHGLRHGYAQVRMDELHTGQFTRQERMEIVSQELGHFRPDIVKAYLR